MYSVVLMAALTTGGNAPDWHLRGGGCCGCCGGWGGYYGGWGGFYGGGGGGNRGWGNGVGYGMVPGSFDGPMFPGPVTPGDKTTTPQGEKLKKPTPDTDKDKESMVPARAKLIVELPPDAKLYIDGLPTSKTSDVRSFNTPALRRGMAFYYVVRAEVIRDGKPVTQTRRVVVRAGQTVRASFKDMDTEAVSTARAK